MKFLDAVLVALGSLRVHKLRTALTVTGISVGTGTLIFTMAVSAGAAGRVVEQIRSLGANLLVVFPGSLTRSGVRLGTGAANTLTEEDATAISSQVSDILLAAPFIARNVQVVAGNSNWATSAYGITHHWLAAREWSVATGRAFTDEELEFGRQAIVLGRTVATRLFGGEDATDQVLRLGRLPMKVVGVLASKGQSAFGSDQDDIVLIPLRTARDRFVGQSVSGSRPVSAIYVKVADPRYIASVQDQIRALMRQRHRLGEGQDDDFGIRNLTEMNAVREHSARTLALMLAAVAAISLLVGGVGIGNIMLVSVSERTREIGVRVAIGARERDIFVQFILEALAVSMGGALLGILIGVSSAVLTSSVSGWPMLIELRAVMLALIACFTIGILAGWFPAKRAARMDPIQSLQDR